MVYLARGGNWFKNELHKERETDHVMDRVRNDMGQDRINIITIRVVVEFDSEHYT